jgi:hypothetical protein
MTTEDAVVSYYKDAMIEMQKTIRSYYEGNIEDGLSHLEMARNRFDALRYHLFQTTHRSGEKG